MGGPLHGSFPGGVIGGLGPGGLDS